MPLRPTPDALRERAFAVLGSDVAGARFLDLFAGTGSVGLEALSRGASRIVFIEHHRAAHTIIQRNISQFEDAAKQIRILCRTASKAITEFARRGEIFDIAWADPPFGEWQEGASVLATAWEKGVLKDNGIACLELPAQANFEDLPPILEVQRELAGGASRLLILGKG